MRLIKTLLVTSLLLATTAFAQEEVEPTHPKGIYQFTTKLSEGEPPHIYWNAIGGVHFLCVVDDRNNGRCFHPTVLGETPVLSVDFSGTKLEIEDQR